MENRGKTWNVRNNLWLKCMIFMQWLFIIKACQQHIFLPFVIKGFQTIVFIFIVISTFRLICVCQTRELTSNFTLHPLLNLRGSPVLIPLAITGYSQDWTCNLQMIVFLRSLGNQRLKPLRYVSCWTIQSEFLGLINLMFLLD